MHACHILASLVEGFYPPCHCSVRQCRFPASLLKTLMTLSCCTASGTFNLYPTPLFLFRKHRDNTTRRKTPKEHNHDIFLHLPTECSGILWDRNSRVGVCKEQFLPRCDAMLSGRNLPTVRWNLLPLSVDWKPKDNLRLYSTRLIVSDSYTGIRVECLPWQHRSVADLVSYRLISICLEYQHPHVLSYFQTVTANSLMIYLFIWIEQSCSFSGGMQLQQRDIKRGNWVALKLNLIDYVCNMTGYEYLPTETGNIMNKCHLYFKASMKFIQKLA